MSQLLKEEMIYQKCQYFTFQTSQDEEQSRTLKPKELQGNRIFPAATFEMSSFKELYKGDSQLFVPKDLKASTIFYNFFLTGSQVFYIELVGDCKIKTRHL